MIRLLFYVLGAFLLALEVQGTAHGVAVRTFGHDGINCSDLLLRQPTAKRESSRFVLTVDCMPSFSSGEAPSRRGQFTGKERDAETGLDYFGARYFSGAMGRFTSPDPVFMTRQRVSDPQQWNLYAYTRNNPLKYVDPDGRDLRLASGVSARDRVYLVRNLARLYATEKGRAYIERVERSPYVVDLSVGKLPRRQVSATSEHVTGGITQYQTAIDGGRKYLNAMGQPGAPDAFPAIQVVVDKGNTSDMGLDPATVLAHELGGHASNVLDLAERDPNNPEITGLDPAQDEASSRKAEKVGKLPGKPSPELLKKIEEILKRKWEDEQ